MKKIFTVPLVIVLVISFLAIGTLAATVAYEYLHQLDQCPIAYDNTNFLSNSEEFPTDTNGQVPTLGDSPIPVFWHFVDPSAQGFVAVIEFGEYGSVTINPYKDGRHYGVITPPYYKVTNAYLIIPENTPEITDNNFMFNLSHVATTPTTAKETTTEATTTQATTTQATTTQGTTTQATTTQPTTTQSTTTQSTTKETTKSTTTQLTTTVETTTDITTTPTTSYEMPEAGDKTNIPLVALGIILALAAVPLTYLGKLTHKNSKSN